MSIFFRTLRTALLCCLLVSASAMPSLAAPDAASREYLLKAAFIYNFVKFVEWPGALDTHKQKSINICILGNNPFSNAATLFKEGSTPSLQLDVIELPAWKGVPQNCHLLFISKSEEGQLGEIMPAVRSQPILTVSDIEGFAPHGGIIGFVLADNKIRLVVNTKAATTAGLRIDAQLLEIALNVIDR